MNFFCQKYSHHQPIFSLVFLFFFYFSTFFLNSNLFSQKLKPPSSHQSSNASSSIPHTEKIPPYLISQYLLNTPNLVEPIPHSNHSSFFSFQFLLESTLNEFSIPNPSKQPQFWKKKYLLLLQTLQFHSDQSTLNLEMYSKNENKHNLFILLYDLVTPQKDYNSYAKIYVNRQFLGQTNQALLSQKKIFKAKIKENVRHLLIVEKYFLNSIKKKWERFKNLFQPKPKYFEIPQNQIRIVKIIYDSSKENSQNAHLKYQYSSFLISDLSKIFDH